MQILPTRTPIAYKLRKYQIQGVNQIIKKFHCRALLADDMGLGKSLQAITVLRRVKYFPAVICVPAFLKYNWIQELEKFAPELDVFICSGQTPNLPKKHLFQIYVINYDILQYWVQEFLKIPEIVECHFTTGPYTMLIKLYARDNAHLMELLNNRLQEIAGVVSTETLISLKQSIKKEVPIGLQREETKPISLEEE